MFQFFFSDEASDFLYNFHTARGDQGQARSHGTAPALH